jgi:hypothetical protein
MGKDGGVCIYFLNLEITLYKNRKRRIMYENDENRSKRGSKKDDCSFQKVWFAIEKKEEKIKMLYGPFSWTNSIFIFHSMNHNFHL